MVKDQTFWDQLDQVCHDAAPAVGAVAGAAYGVGAATVTDSPELANMVADTIGGFVTDHWGDVCDLPANLSDTFSNLSPADNSPAPAADNSPAPGDSLGQDI